MKPHEKTDVKSSVISVNPPNKSKKRTIVVLGVERGGTSMVGGIIRAMGVNLGDHAGRNHEDPRFLKEDEDYLLKQIKNNNERHDVWGFKIPKASLKVDFYSNHLRNPHFIMVFRNIASVVDSWITRTGSNPLSTVIHTLNYYNKATEDLIKSGRPLILVNYERACIHKRDFINAIGEFAGINLDKEIIEKAYSTITSDGGGYLDIPDFYFHIESFNPESVNGNPYQFSFDKRSKGNSRNKPKLTSDRLILSPKGRYFPEDFCLKFNLDTKDDQFIIEKGLRVRFEFEGGYFPGQAIRPDIFNGLNLLRILNNGKVKRISLGPLHSGRIYSISSVECYDDINEDALEAREIVYKKSLTSRISLLSERIKRKINKILNT